MIGVKFRQIVCGMYDSQQQILLCAEYILNSVSSCYNEEIEKKVS